MGSIGPGEILLLALLAVLLFGADKLPQMARSLGRGVRELKESVNGVSEIQETVGAVSEIRSAMSVGGLANAVLPSEVTEAKDALSLTGGATASESDATTSAERSAATEAAAERAAAAVDE